MHCTQCSAVIQSFNFTLFTYKRTYYVTIQPTGPRRAKGQETEIVPPSRKVLATRQRRPAICKQKMKTVASDGGYWNKNEEACSDKESTEKGLCGRWTCWAETWMPRDSCTSLYNLIPASWTTHMIPSRGTQLWPPGRTTLGIVVHLKEYLTTIKCSTSVLQSAQSYLNRWPLSSYFSSVLQKCSPPLLSVRLWWYSIHFHFYFLINSATTNCLNILFVFLPETTSSIVGWALLCLRKPAPVVQFHCASSILAGLARLKDDDFSLWLNKKRLHIMY